MEVASGEIAVFVGEGEFGETIEVFAGEDEVDVLGVAAFDVAEDGDAADEEVGDLAGFEESEESIGGFEEVAIGHRWVVPVFDIEGDSVADDFSDGTNDGCHWRMLEVGGGFFGFCGSRRFRGRRRGVCCLFLRKTDRGDCPACGFEGVTDGVVEEVAAWHVGAKVFVVLLL